jgi:hypothetical protein
MLTLWRWSLKVSAPKNKDQMLDTKATAYLFDEVYRVCFANNRQIYYFESPAMEYKPEELIKVAEDHFNTNRQSLDVAKCVRCSKWHVIDGQFCNRCKDSIKSYDTSQISVTEIEVQI